MIPRRTITKLFLAVAVLPLLLLLAVLSFPKQVLLVDSGPVKADALVVLGGGWLERPRRAAELFKAGEAPRILVSGLGDCQYNQQLLQQAGVPSSVIRLEGASRNTFENAKYSIPLLRQMGAHRVILVTTWYHSRRALETFEHLAPDLKFYSRPSYLGYDDGNRPVIRNYIHLEYPKLLGYWLWHGVSPF